MPIYSKPDVCTLSRIAPNGDATYELGQPVWSGFSSGHEYIGLTLDELKSQYQSMENATISLSGSRLSWKANMATHDVNANAYLNVMKIKLPSSLFDCIIRATFISGKYSQTNAMTAASMVVTNYGYISNNAAFVYISPDTTSNIGEIYSSDPLLIIKNGNGSLQVNELEIDFEVSPDGGDTWEPLFSYIDSSVPDVIVDFNRVDIRLLDTVYRFHNGRVGVDLDSIEYMSQTLTNEVTITTTFNITEDEYHFLNENLKRLVLVCKHPEGVAHERILGHTWRFSSNINKEDYIVLEPSVEIPLRDMRGILYSIEGYVIKLPSDNRAGNVTITLVPDSRSPSGFAYDLIGIFSIVSKTEITGYEAVEPIYVY